MADNQPTDAGEENANLKHMREKAERADALVEENRLLKTNFAFTQAGIDTTEGTPGALLYSTFKVEEGQDITADAVLEYAQRFGVTPKQAEAATPQPQEQQEPVVNEGRQAAESQFFQQASNVGNASDAAVSGEQDPNDASYRAFDGRMKAGSPREDAAAAGMAEIFAGAARGDKRAVYDQKEWRERNR